MGSSAEAEMERLVQGLRSAYHERVAGVMDIRSATRHELAELRTMRGAMTAQQRRWRTEYVDDLRQDVDELRKVTQTFLQETDAAQQMTASSQSRALIDGRDKLRQTTQALLGELGAAQEAMSAAQRQRLSEHTKALRQEVDELRKVTQTFLQEMDAAQQMTASSQSRALIDGRDKLRQTTQALLGELDAAQEAMSAAQCQRLSEHTKALRQDVDELRRRFRCEQSQIRADQGKARSLWNGLVAPAGETRAPLREAVAPAPAAPEPPPPAVSVTTAEPVAAVPEGESVEQSLDDLTVIPGIGPAMQRRLRRAGVDTYAQLASSTPEFLRQSLGDIGPLAKVDEWIAEVQRLIGAS